VVESLRVAIFLELCRGEQRSPKRNIRNLVATLWSFCHPWRHSPIPEIPENLPLLLFPFSTGAHLLNMLPVAREAKRRNALGGIATGSFKDEAMSEFGPVVTQNELLSLAGVRQLPEIVRQVWRSFRRLIAVFSREDPILASRLKQSYGKMIRQLVLSKRMEIAFSRLLSKWKPSCIISTSDNWPFEFQLFCQAKRLGIPNAVIQHGEPNGVVSWPVYADTFLVWGSEFRDRFLRMGAPSDRLRICGMPASDELFVRFKDGTRKPRSTASPSCLLFSHAHDRGDEPELFDAFAAYLKEIIRLTPRFRWLIKLHPAEDDSFYREHGFTSSPHVEILQRSVSLQEAIEQADVACTIRSTAGLQAMMMQCPVVVIDLIPEKGNPVTWPLRGGGIAAKTPEDFTQYVNRLVDDRRFRDSSVQSQREFLDEAFANGGNAAGSIVDYLQEQNSAGSAHAHCLKA
jgi:hypothetical protein